MKGTTILRQSLILLLGLPLWLASCAEDEEPRSYMPALATNSASGLTRFAATLSGSVTAVSGSTAAYDVFFLFAQGSSLTDAREVSAVPDPSVEGRYAGLAEGLVPGGDYCYAICARSGGSVARGELITFSTLESTVPVPGETFTALLSENSVTLSSSELLDDGGLEITQRGFAYKVYEEGDSEPLTSDRTRTVPLDAETFMAQITGLQAHTTYVARAYAVNRTGTGYGSSVVFTTEDLKVPQLLCSASDSTSTSSSIQAEATLTSNGGFAVTAYGFCWSTESATPTVDNLRQEVGTGEVASFQALLADLEPATTYYLRAYAVNERGTGYSNTVTVQTTERQTVSLSQPQFSELSVSSVTLSSTLTVPAGSEVTDKGICYSQFSTRPTIGDAHLSDPQPGTAVLVSLTGLEEGATYYATAYAQTRDGVFYSDPVSFTLSRTYEPSLSLTGVVEIGETEATATARIDSDGGREVLERGFVWSATSTSPSLDRGDPSQTVDGTEADFSLRLSGLEKGQRYYIRAYARNEVGLGYSSVSEFTTALTRAPEVVNLSMLLTGDDHATAQATIADDGGATITERGFLYSTTVVSPTLDDADVLRLPSSDAAATFTAQLTGLTYTTRYYLRAYAVNDKGVGYSSPINFVTESSTVPSTSVTVDDATVTHEGATFVGQLNSNGNADVTEVGFCWSEQSEPTLETASSAAATLDGTSFTLSVDGLGAYAYYYVRAYARNKNGVGYSYSATFRTQRAAPGAGDNRPPEELTQD